MKPTRVNGPDARMLAMLAKVLAPANENLVNKDVEACVADVCQLVLARREQDVPPTAPEDPRPTFVARFREVVDYDVEFHSSKTLKELLKGDTWFDEMDADPAADGWINTGSVAERTLGDLSREDDDA